MENQHQYEHDHDRERKESSTPRMFIATLYLLKGDIDEMQEYIKQHPDSPVYPQEMIDRRLEQYNYCRSWLKEDRTDRK